jgi:hypothetical protein
MKKKIVLLAAMAVLTCGVANAGPRLASVHDTEEVVISASDNVVISASDNVVISASDNKCMAASFVDQVLCGVSVGSF